jgi:hypothetical protein
MATLSAIVDPHPDEISYGWNVLCFEDADYVTRFFFANRDDADTMKARWESGHASTRHMALVRLEMNLQ